MGIYDWIKMKTNVKTNIGVFIQSAKIKNDSIRETNAE